MLWADKSAKLVLSLIEKYLVGFSIFWLIFVTLIFLPQLTSGQETYEITINEVPTDVSFSSFLLFASIFPLTGLAMLAGVLGAAKFRTGQIYAITDRRCLLISSFLMHRIASIPHGKILKTQRIGKTDIGSLEFQTLRESKWFAFDPDWFFEMKTFSGIRNPKIVEELILSLQKEES